MRKIKDDVDWVGAVDALADQIQAKHAELHANSSHS